MTMLSSVQAISAIAAALGCVLSLVLAIFNSPASHLQEVKARIAMPNAGSDPHAMRIAPGAGLCPASVPFRAHATPTTRSRFGRSLAGLARRTPEDGIRPASHQPLFSLAAFVHPSLLTKQAGC